jgi:small subunit ribosomal protein S1
MESFAQLFEESLARQEMRQGEVITAEVVLIDHNFVVVNAGLKSESYVPLEEFLSDQGELEVKWAISSRSPSKCWKTATAQPACRAIAPSASPPGTSWRSPERQLPGHRYTITGKVKGGLTVMTNGVRAFLPGSLVDMRPVKDTTPYEGKTIRIQGHQARPQAQQRRRVPPCRARSHR